MKITDILPTFAFIFGLVIGLVIKDNIDRGNEKMTCEITQYESVCQAPCKVISSYQAEVGK